MNKIKHSQKKEIKSNKMNTLTPEQRMKLETLIEKEVHYYFTRVCEMTSDDVFLFARRQNLEIDPNLFSALMENVRASFANNKLKHFDSFSNKIKSVLDEYDSMASLKKKNG